MSKSSNKDTKSNLLSGNVQQIIITWKDRTELPASADYPVAELWKISKFSMLPSRASFSVAIIYYSCSFTRPFAFFSLMKRNIWLIICKISSAAFWDVQEKIPENKEKNPFLDRLWNNCAVSRHRSHFAAFYKKRLRQEQREWLDIKWNVLLSK